MSRAFFAVFLVLLPLVEGRRALRREFDVDELQHTHAGWRWSRGETPYRDFFEHHGPALAAVLSKTLRDRPVDTSAEAAAAYLIGARGAFWVNALLILLLTAFAARALGASGAAAAFLLATVGLYWDKAVEIRPDGPAALLVLLAFLAPRAGQNTRSHFRSGLAWGGALAFGPKAIFPLLGHALDRARAVSKRGLRDGLGRALGWQAAGFLTVALLVVAGLASAGALPGFWRYGVVWNLEWRNRFGPGVVLFGLLRENPAFALSGALGFLHLLREPSSPDRKSWVWIVGATLAGLSLNPVPYAQSFLTVLPLWAAGAAVGAEGLARRAAARWGARGGDAVLALIFLTALAPHLHRRLKPFERNDRQIALLSIVNEAIPPEGPVLDSWTGLGVFRPHADFFPHRHLEIVKMLPPDWAERLAEDLESGKIRPAGVLGDRDFRRASPRLDRYLKENFEPVSGDVVWRRSPGRSARAAGIHPRTAFTSHTRSAERQSRFVSAFSRTRPARISRARNTPGSRPDDTGGV